jgi:predicted nucleic acid-binding protein
VFGRADLGVPFIEPSARRVDCTLRSTAGLAAQLVERLLQPVEFAPDIGAAGLRRSRARWPPAEAGDGWIAAIAVRNQLSLLTRPISRTCP